MMPPHSASVGDRIAGWPRRSIRVLRRVAPAPRASRARLGQSGRARGEIGLNLLGCARLGRSQHPGVNQRYGGPASTSARSAAAPAPTRCSYVKGGGSS